MSTSLGSEAGKICAHRMVLVSDTFCCIKINAVCSAGSAKCPLTVEFSY